ncbi:thiol peroxidase [uncultured Clostridium sp.]|uniref:thiol peroxidase n=1 Tax=uncultured Clostridium sp. TaxID=59620 RepID=UPI00261F3568|nr:thiol peroxidase [uncultured Clostridium sp.]
MNVVFDGLTLKLSDKEVKVGDKAPDFSVCKSDLQEVTLKDTKGKRVFLAIPSVDTPVCDLEIKRFNKEAAALGDVTIYTFSLDLPFAQERWCGANGVDKVVTLSDYKTRSFGKNYGVYIEDVALLTRAVFVLDENDNVIYVEYCKDASDHPDYDAVLEILK